MTDPVTDAITYAVLFFGVALLALGASALICWLVDGCVTCGRFMRGG